MPTDSSAYDGRQEEIRGLKLPAIDVFRNIYPDRDYAVTMTIPEFTCVCPKTGLPDFATLALDYAPAENCLELKSFKEYLLEFRNVGIFHENVVNRVLDDVVAACSPHRARLTGVFNSRGGIQTTVTREYSARPR